MSASEWKAADVTPPRPGGTVNFAVTTSAAAPEAPTSWAGKYVRFQADGGIVYMYLSAANTPAVTTGTAGQVGWKIADGTYQDFFIKGHDADKYLHHIGSASCTLRTCIVSP